MILQLRLYALYFRNKRILALTTFVSLGAAISSSYVMGHALSLITGLSFSAPLITFPVDLTFLLPDNSLRDQASSIKFDSVRAVRPAK